MSMIERTQREQKQRKQRERDADAHIFSSMIDRIDDDHQVSRYNGMLPGDGIDLSSDVGQSSLSQAASLGAAAFRAPASHDNNGTTPGGNPKSKSKQRSSEAPTRTSSAPPDEHPATLEPKRDSFQPTKMTKTRILKTPPHQTIEPPKRSSEVNYPPLVMSSPTNAKVSGQSQPQQSPTAVSAGSGPVNISSPQGATSGVASPRQPVGAPVQVHAQTMHMQGGPRPGGPMMYSVSGGASPPIHMQMPPGAQISPQGQIILTGLPGGEMPHGTMTLPSGMAFRAAGPGGQLYPVQIAGGNMQQGGQPLLYTNRGYMSGYPQQQQQQLQQGPPRAPMPYIPQQQQQQYQQQSNEAQSRPPARSSPQSKSPTELQQQGPRGLPSSPQQIPQQQRYPSYPASPIQQRSTDPRDPRSVGPMGPVVGTGGAFIGVGGPGQFYQTQGQGVPQGQGGAPRFYHDPSQAQSQLQGQQQQQYMFRYPVPVSMQAMPSGQPFVGGMPMQMMTTGAMGQMGGQVNIGSLQHGVAPHMAMPTQNMPQQQQQQQQQRPYQQEGSRQISPMDARASSTPRPKEEPSTSPRDAGTKSETEGTAAATTTTKKKYTIRNKQGDVVDMSYFKASHTVSETVMSEDTPEASSAISSNTEAIPESQRNIDSCNASAESPTPLTQEDSGAAAAVVSVSGLHAATETKVDEPSLSDRMVTVDTDDPVKPTLPILPTAGTEAYPIVSTPAPRQSAAMLATEEMSSLAVRIVDNEPVALTAGTPAPSMIESSPIPVQVDLTWRDVMSPPSGSSKVDVPAVGETSMSDTMAPAALNKGSAAVVLSPSLPAHPYSRHAEEEAASRTPEVSKPSAAASATSAPSGLIPDELGNLMPVFSFSHSDSIVIPTSATVISPHAHTTEVETTMIEKPAAHQPSVASEDTTNGSESTDLKTRVDVTLPTLPAPLNINPLRSSKKATALRNNWRGGGDMLDAYTDTVAPFHSPPVIAPPVAATTISTASTEAATPTTPEPADDWEETADKIAELVDSSIIPVAAAPNERRRLVPGGSTLLARAQPRLNAGPKSMQPLTKRLITKEELLKLRPSELPERPPTCSAYISISLIDERALPRAVKCMGYWNFRGESLAQQQPQHQYMGGPSQGQADKRQYYQSQHGQRGDGHRERDAPHSRGYDDGPGYGHGHGGRGGGGNGSVPYNPSGATGWKRDSGRGSGGGGLGRDSFIVRQRKLATDPVELLSQSVVAILNKITPQTFDKLTAQLCAIPIATSALLDKLVELVFEKAVQEQHFANLYADMCNKLESASKSWSFLQVAFDDDNKSYFWMRDLEFDNVLAGPYRSINECMEAVEHESPLMVPVAAPCRIETIIKKNDVLSKVFQNIESETPEFFVSYMPFSNIPKENLGDNMFDEIEDAQREADKRNGMRRRLVMVCQQEFDSSTKNLGVYGQARKEEQEFKQLAKTLTPDARQARETELNENAMKLKKRMFGNIRFIGELYKKSMISTSIMNECIMYFIAERDENGEFAGFKSEHDEQGLELLCRLLKTVGGQMEAKAAKARIEVQFNWYLDHLRDLSKDKSINSRIRFSIDEVVEMRRNGWVARREQEGPATLEEIHKKIALEEQSRALQQQQHQPYGGQRIVRSSTAGAPSHGQTVGYDISGGELRRANSIAYSSSQPQQQPYPSSQPSHKQFLSHSQHQHPPHLRSQPQPSGGSPVITGIMNRGSPGHVSGSRGPTPQVSSIPALPVAASATASTALDSKSKDRLRSMVQDLVRTQDFAEFDVALKGFPSQAPALACLALNIAAKYLDSSKDEVHKQLELLVERLSPRLAAARAEVEEALCTSEQLTLLYDASVDCQKAPELLGKIIGKLVKAGACRAAVIESVATKCSTDADAAEDCGCSLGDLVAVYARFTLAMSKE